MNDAFIRKQEMDKEKPKGKTDIEELKHLVKKKKIQNEALQKIMNKLNESNNKK